MLEKSTTRTLLALNMRCYLCPGGADGLQEHHIINRSQGGADGPTLWICQDCHRHFTDELWDAYLDEAEFKVVKKASGEIVWQQSRGVDSKRAFINLHNAREALAEISQYIPYMDNEQLVELFKGLQFVGKSGWEVQCAIVGYAFSCRFVHGDKVQRLRALGSELGVSVGTLYGYFNAWTAFHERLGEVIELLDYKTSYVITAAGTDDPDKWLDHAIEEYGAGYYPLAKMRAEIKGEEWKPRLCPWLAEDGVVCERYKAP